jgi:sec-independent protein translocase protein TatC
MPLREHLAEARTRLLLVLAGIAVGAIGGWFLFPWAYELLQRPILDAAEREGSVVSINFSGVVTALDLRLKVAVFLGIVGTSPWWLYQVWAFVAPGLKKREKRYTLGFLGAAVPLFAAGVALGLWVLPHAVEILTGFVPDDSTNLVDAQGYLTFAMRLMVAFGLAFAFPVVMVGLTWMGAVTPRTWLKGWRWAVLTIFVFAAVMTPTPDALTMIVMALPMCGLYFLAIGIGALRRRSRRKAAE